MTVCNLCIYNPPSSADGKPCTMCPASTNAEVKAVPIEVLREMRNELTKHYVDPYNRNAFRYTTVSLLEVLDLIDKHLKEYEGSDIDGIKAEIKTEISDYEGCADFNEGIRFGLRTALEIIDKHIKES